MSPDLYLREREIPPRIPQDVIDEIMNRPVKSAIITGDQRLSQLMQKKEIVEEASYLVALSEAQKVAGSSGFLASAPQIIAARTLKGGEGFATGSYTAFSELHLGTRARPNNAFELVMVVLHGVSLISNENLPKYFVGSAGSTLRLSTECLEGLLKGKLPNGESIDVYTVKEADFEEVLDPFGKYAVVVNSSELKSTVTGMIDDDEFMRSPLVTAIAGTSKYLHMLMKTCIKHYEDIMLLSPTISTARGGNLGESVGVMLDLKNKITISYCRPLESAGRFIAVRGSELG